MQREYTSSTTQAASPRPAARGLRLSSSFKASVEAAGNSGASTPTEVLLTRASDIISRSVRRESPLISPRNVQQDATEAPAAGITKLRSCLSLRRHTDSPGQADPDAEAAGGQAFEHKELHWKPELVTSSEADHRAESCDHKAETRELQARYLKLEGDLKEAENGKAMLSKQVHRVQEAMVHSRDEMETAQRLAVAAEERAAAAEARAVAAEEKAAALSREVMTCFLCNHTP